ncbi:hypothetical protein Gpo141_00010085 [Globisporangium polare]
MYAAETEEINQSMAELHEFAQQLLKEEARISSLFPRTSPKSPGVNRMSFSDKLHKMIEFAESSMYEHSAGPAPFAQNDREEHEGDGSPGISKRDLSQAREVTELPSIQKQASFRGQAVAEAKPASQRSTTPKSKGAGYKQSWSPAATQRKAQQVPKPSQSELSSLAALPDLKTGVPFSFDAVETAIVSRALVAPLSVPEKASVKLEAGASSSDDAKAIESIALIDASLLSSISSENSDVVKTPPKQSLVWDEAHIPEDVMPEEIAESRASADPEDSKAAEAVARDEDEEPIAEQILSCEDPETPESRETSHEKLVETDAPVIAEEIMTSSPTKESALRSTGPALNDEECMMAAAAEDVDIPETQIAFGDVEDTTESAPPSIMEVDFEGHSYVGDYLEPALDEAPAQENERLQCDELPSPPSDRTDFVASDAVEIACADDQREVEIVVDPNDYVLIAEMKEELEGHGEPTLEEDTSEVELRVDDILEAAASQKCGQVAQEKEQERSGVLGRDEEESSEVKSCVDEVLDAAVQDVTLSSRENQDMVSEANDRLADTEDLGESVGYEGLSEEKTEVLESDFYDDLDDSPYIVVDLDIVRTLTHTFVESGVESALIDIEVRQKIQLMIPGVLVLEADDMNEAATARELVDTTEQRELTFKPVEDLELGAAHAKADGHLEEQAVQIETESAIISVQSAIAVATATNAIIVSALRSVIEGLCSTPCDLAESTIVAVTDESLAESMKQFVELQVPVLLSAEVFASPESPPAEEFLSAQLPSELDVRLSEGSQPETNEAEKQVSVPMALEIRKTVAVAIAQSLERVIERLQRDSTAGDGANSIRGDALANPPLDFVVVEEPANHEPCIDEDSQELEQVSVSMSLSIRQNVNAIIASTLEQVVESLRMGETSFLSMGASESSLPPSSAAEARSIDMNEGGTDTAGTFEDPISVQMAIAIRRSVNGIIALSLESAAERLTRLPKASTPTEDPQAQEHGIEDRDADVATMDAATDAAVPEADEQEDEEENAEESLSVEMSIAICQTVNGLIALSLKNVVDHLSQQPEPVIQEVTANLELDDNTVPPLKLGSATDVRKLDTTTPAEEEEDVVQEQLTSRHDYKVKLKLVHQTKTPVRMTLICQQWIP